MVLDPEYINFWLKVGAAFGIGLLVLGVLLLVILALIADDVHQVRKQLVNKGARIAYPVDDVYDERVQ